MSAPPNRAAQRGWVITGTDTGVGKTITAAALCRMRRELGQGVVYVKPVQSGVADGDDDASDVAALADVPTVVGPLVGPSLAPGVAVRLAGAVLAGDELREVIDSAMQAHRGAEVVVEGAGGLLVELGSDGTTVADLAALLGLPVIVVARPGLGTLNHTALTLEALAHRGLTLAGVVVCGYPDQPDEAARTNLAELQRISAGRLIGVLPQLDFGAADPLAAVTDHLGAALGGSWSPSTLAAAPGRRDGT